MAARIPAKAYLGFFQAPQQQVGDEDEGLLGGGQPGGGEGANPDESFFGESEGAAPPGTPTGTPTGSPAIEPYSPEWFMVVYGLTAEQAQVAANHWAFVESKLTSPGLDPQTGAWVNAPSGDPANSAKVGQGVKVTPTFNQPDPNFDVGFNLTPAQSQIAKAAWAEARAANPPGTALDPFGISDWAAKQTGAPVPPRKPAPGGRESFTANGIFYAWNGEDYENAGPAPKTPRDPYDFSKLTALSAAQQQAAQQYYDTNPDEDVNAALSFARNTVPGEEPPEKPEKTYPLPQGWLETYTDDSGNVMRWDNRRGQYMAAGYAKPPDAAGIKAKADADAAQRADEEEARRAGLSSAIQRGMFGYTTDERGQGAFGYRQPDYSGFGGMPPPVSFADAARAYRTGAAPSYIDVPDATFFGSPGGPAGMSGQFGTGGIPAGSVRVQQGTPGYNFFSGQGLQPQQAQPDFSNIPQEPTAPDWAAMSPASQAAWMTVAGQYGVTADPASRANYSRSFWQRNMPVRPSPGYTAARPGGPPLRQEVVPGMLRPQSFWRR